MKFIQSKDNPFFKQLKRLSESGRERKKQGLTLLDGIHLVSAYEEIHGAVDQLIVAESAQNNPEISAYLTNRNFTCLTDSLMKDLGLVDTPTGLLAVVPIAAASSVWDLQQNCILLDQVQDPGNVGTILRTAAALGIRQVILSAGCAAVWSPKTLRAGQGAHFVLDIYEDSNLLEFTQVYQGRVAVTCLENATSLFDTKLTAPIAWVFGAEGAGVSQEVMVAADTRVKIPMPGKVESLNVAAAAAICLYETYRQQAAG